MTDIDEDWRDLGVSEPEIEDGQIDEYDLTSTPNDFNTTTIFNFIESGAVKIPGFQRNYVWDIKRASKLIESLIIGLPVPQVFLYEEGRNNFLVIDGQQRLMTIYYFSKGRFPKMANRVRLREIFNSQGKIPDDVLDDDDYFDDFNLKLPEIRDGVPNKFAGMNYDRMGDYRVQFDLRTIRNVIVKQVKPSDDDSSVYEMFSRLNTGGINLTPQQIRFCLYYSDFYDLLAQLNLDSGWRRILGQQTPDLNTRDIEVLLRAIAVWQEGDSYKPSMVKFLNNFSRRAQSFDARQIAHIRETFGWFITATHGVDPSAFQTRQGKFNVLLFEAVFAAASILHSDNVNVLLNDETIEAIRSDETFQSHARQRTTDTTNVTGRRKRAQKLLAETCQEY
jgi:Protein of unknown function DUF262